MHPAIRAFPSSRFYGGRLRDGVAAEDKRPPRGLPWPSPLGPVAFVDVDDPGGYWRGARTQRVWLFLGGLVW